MTTISPLDYLVILAYLVLTIVIGLYVGLKMTTGTDFFLAGRQLPWWAIGLSLVATDISGTDIIGVGGAAFKHGLAVANFEWIGCVPAMIIGAFVFVPHFYRTGVYTIPEFLERRFSLGVRLVLATCWLVFMASNLGVMLLASAKMMSALFGWDAVTCIWVTAVLVGFYTCAGGLAAVVYTDTLQCALMIAGCLLVVIIGLYEVGGWQGLSDRLQQIQSNSVTDQAGAAENGDGPGTSNDVPPPSADDRLKLILPVDTRTPFPWTGIFFGLALILSPAYWIGNQAIIQRSLGAKSDFEAKASYVWGALLKIVIPVIIAVPGLIAYALFPDLADGDRAVPTLVGTYLPSGLRGLFVAAFLAALMSSIDSYLNSAATIVAFDFHKRLVDPNVTPERQLTIGRITTVALTIWAILFALALAQLSENSGIYAIFQTLMAFFQGPALAVLLAGVFSRRATAPAALAGLLCGIATSVSLFTLNQPFVAAWLGILPLFRIQDPFLYFSVWAFLAAIAVITLVSLATPRDPEAKTALVLSPKKKRNQVRSEVSSA